MKSLWSIAILAVAGLAPISSFAQQNVAPVTRAQVKAELAQLERAGYNPRDWYHYPQNIQAAQQKIDATRTAPTDSQRQ
jgi:hypothetical protein